MTFSLPNALLSPNPLPPRIPLAPPCLSIHPPGPSSNSPLSSLQYIFQFKSFPQLKSSESLFKKFQPCKSFTQHMQRTHIPVMDVGTSANTPQIPARTREGGGQYNPPLAVHKIIFPFLGILLALLGVKHANKDLPSPFVTDDKTLTLFIADLFAYVVTLTIAKIQASNNTNMGPWMNNISILCGTFAAVLLMFLLIRDFGWLLLACWVGCVVIIVICMYETPRRLCTAAVGRDREKMRELMVRLKELMVRLKGTEEPENQDGMP